MLDEFGFVVSCDEAKDWRLSHLLSSELLAVVFEPRSLGGRRDERVENRSASGGPMRKVLLCAVFGVLISVGPALAAPSAPWHHCRYDTNLGSGIGHLRIRMQARKLDDYLPRCELASFIATDANGRKHFQEHGARWFLGRVTCSYRYGPTGKVDRIAIHTRCQHARIVVRFDAYA